MAQVGREPASPPMPPLLSPRVVGSVPGTWSFSGPTTCVFLVVLGISIGFGGGSHIQALKGCLSLESGRCPWAAVHAGAYPCPRFLVQCCSSLEPLYALASATIPLSCSFYLKPALLPTQCLYPDCQPVPFQCSRPLCRSDLLP